MSKGIVHNYAADSPLAGILRDYCAMYPARVNLPALAGDEFRRGGNNQGGGNAEQGVTCISTE